jgi:hypothetical protein
LRLIGNLYSPTMNHDSSPNDRQSEPIPRQPYLVQFQHVSSAAQVSASSRPEPDKHFVCDVPGCRARSFKRRGDLRRHSKKHNTQHVYDCSAVDCNRTGKRGFTRKDKMVDHMLAGHDEDAIFSCLVCGVKLPRDIFAVHDRRRYVINGALNFYRTCPLRCSFKVRVPKIWTIAGGLTVMLKRMDTLQYHLLEKHDLRERRNYTNLLEQKGYDARTCEAICPICTPKCKFSDHEEFKEHFVQTHFLGPACSEHDSDKSCPIQCHGRDQRSRLTNCTSVPDEVRQHRCTILRLWPMFGNHPVWEDIMCPGTSMWS